MSAESPRHVRSGGPLLVPSQPPSDRSIIDTVSGFINDVTLSSSSTVDPKDVIQWARFETADINEPTPENEGDSDISPLLLVLGYGSGVQVWLIPPNGEAQEVLSWRQGTVRVLRILPTPQHGDCFASKRPLIALCDSASPGPPFCSLSFISIKGGEQVKSIKFKNPILDVLANKHSVVVSFSERFAVFDAGMLEDRMAVTTCYPCPCPLGGSAPINPLALGDRWLAYADKKLNQSKRSNGGCEGEGVPSYTASVLHAAKSLSKGLRGLSESVAQSLAGGRSTSQSPSPPNQELQQPGVVTILDLEGNEKDDGHDSDEPYDPIVAHFVAHSDAIIALKFDSSGMLLVTADRRGHDFHVFRINPHPCGPSSASVHHLYILHRGDTTAKVQDIAISCDSRWAAISTLRGTTHVFPISPYGGAAGVRTHSQPRVVNRLSRFHRSAGLPIHGVPRAGSPVGDGINHGAWFPNPRLPPYPIPTTVSPLAQIRPTANLPTHTITRTSSGRQRLSSMSEDSSGVPLLTRVRFGSTRGVAHATLYVVPPSGLLLQLQLHVRPARSVPKEKICDESPIELDVEPVAQWPLQRPPAAADLLAPLPPSNPLLQPMKCRRCADICLSEEERWLSQVEIVTHAGPHRRLWMGPQFVFKTYNCTGSSSSLSEAETVEVEAVAGGPARSTPVNMPTVRPILPVLIDSGSASSLEHSPSDSFRRRSLLSESGRAPSVCDIQLREDLAEAMKEDNGRSVEHVAAERRNDSSAGVALAVDPRGTVAPAALNLGGPASPSDGDSYTRPNEDEARFRPVVRCAATLPLRHEPELLRPLPSATTIPARRRTVSPPSPRPHSPRALHSAVVIPAALSDDSADSVLFDKSLDNPLTRPETEHSSTPEATPRPESSSSVERPPAEEKYLHFEKSNRTSQSSDKISDSSKGEVSKRVETRRNKKKKDSADADKFKLEETRELTIDEAPPMIEPRKDVRTDLPELLEVTGGFEMDSKAAPVPFRTIDQIEKKLDAEFDKYVVDETTPPIMSVEKMRPSSKKWNKNREPVDEVERTPSVSVVLKLPKRNSSVPKTSFDEDIKTEEQAWNMLLDVSENSISIKDAGICNKNIEETKTKLKRNRKSKKEYDEVKKKADDSFVEIHAIEDREQPCSGELVVTIASSYEDAELLNPSFYKTKKARAHKSITPERPDDFDKQKNDKAKQQSNRNIDVSESMITDLFASKCGNVKNLDLETQKFTHIADDYIENASLAIDIVKEEKSSKSSLESAPIEKKLNTFNTEKREVYIINTTEEDFPDIQLTRPPRVNKRQHGHNRELEDVETDKAGSIEKPVKSWSSVAATKTIQKHGKEDSKMTLVKRENQNVLMENLKSSKEVSLHDKLFELCKRTDIMVAECDVPSELNFIDEHHSVLHDLPPLEPLNFGLNDFNIEVMRDSLLDVNESKIKSPISKINIDDILSSIKDTSSKAIESGTFNMVDVEKVPVKKEKGFKVIEDHNIITQEINVDEDIRTEEKDIEMMEKSSDEDITSPIILTDSDKEDKKNMGASNIISPLTKQSSKPKKSRRRKK